MARSLEICPSYRESNKKNKEARARCPFPVVASLPPKGREATTRNASSVRRLCTSKRERFAECLYNVKFGMVNETLRATIRDTLQTA